VRFAGQSYLGHRNLWRHQLFAIGRSYHTVFGCDDV
jgi:hypothetical protein